MKTIIFDGKAEAKKILDETGEEAGKFKKEKGRKLKLVSIVVGDISGNLKYSSLKKKRAETVGIRFEMKTYPESTSVNRIIRVAGKLNEDDTVDGIMVQMPMPEHFTKLDQSKLINEIDSKKDVDGMRETTGFTAPVVLAVEHALKSALDKTVTKENPIKVTIIGAKGFVGSKIVRCLCSDDRLILIEADLDTEKLDQLTSSADVVISAVGKQGLVKSEMVKRGVVAIDVGAPMGDFEKSVYKKASFITPVPGGIGPLTIAYLMRNMVTTVA